MVKGFKVHVAGASHRLMTIITMNLCLDVLEVDRFRVERPAVLFLSLQASTCHEQHLATNRYIPSVLLCAAKQNSRLDYLAPAPAILMYPLPTHTIRQC